MDTSNQGSRLIALLLTALTIVILIVVQAHHFHDRPYRQDEAWVVHYAMSNVEQNGAVAHFLAPLHSLYPENFFQDAWVLAFGHHERIVRFYSTLISVFALGVMYRLASDLFDRRTGWFALVLLGTYGIFSYYSHEARPYAMLAFGSVGFQLALLRFIRLPNLRRGLATLLIAVVTAFVHPFVSFVIAAQLICVLVFARWNRDLYRRGVVLFGSLALIVGYRAYINYVARQGVIHYNVDSSWEGLRALYDYFRFNPEALGLLLLAGGVLACLMKIWTKSPAPSAYSGLDSRMRHRAYWREGWLVISALATLVLPLLVNNYSPSLTPRNLLILAPALVLIAVIALRQMPQHIQLLIVFFFFIPFVTQFRSFNGNAGYWELSAYLNERAERSRDRIVVVTAQHWESIPINYYLQERTDLGLTPHDIFYVSATNPADDPVAPPSFDEELFVTGYGPDDWERLSAYLGDSDRLWLIKGNPSSGGQAMLNAVDEEYTLYSAVDFPGETYYRDLEVLEYRRQPGDLEPLWRFGEEINLLRWQLNGDHSVQPCAQISVDTWWSTKGALDKLYSSTLVIAGADGQGVANADNVPGGLYLTTIWQPGELYFDERSLTVPCDLAEGEYPLLLGMYEVPRENETLTSLPVYTNSGEPTGRRYEYLTTLVVRR